MSKQSYQLERPVRYGGELHREGTIDLSDKDAKPLLACGAISTINGKASGPAKGEGSSGAPSQQNPNRIPAPEDAHERLAIIKVAITKMEGDKKDEEWTKQSGPQLKPLAEVVGFDVTVEERNQAYAELHPQE